MKFKGATRHNQFDDWIAFLPAWRYSSNEILRGNSQDGSPIISCEIWCKCEYITWSSGRSFRCSFHYSFHLFPDASHMLSIQQVYISTMESEIFSTIDSAGQLIKMAVIWLETFHNQFDVSDRKRYIPMFMVLQRRSSNVSFLASPPLSSRFAYLSPLFLACSVTRFPYFFRFLNHRKTLKTDTILIIKAGCDSRTLWQTNFDGKSMPCLSSECRYLRFPWMPHALFTFNLLLFFLLMEIFEWW